MGCGCNNGCGCGSSWIVILIIILLLCGGFGNCGCGNDCGCGWTNPRQILQQAQQILRNERLCKPLLLPPARGR